MHLWLQGRSRHPLIGAALYMAAPYHLIDAYVRGALAEAASFVWLPLIALAIDRLQTRRGPALLALAYAGLILTHLPMAVLASVFLIPPLVLMSGPLSRPRLASAAAGIGLGLMLAAPYLLPALTLRGAVHAEALNSAHFDPRRWAPWRITPDDSDRFCTFALIALGWSILAFGAARRQPAWSTLTVATAACSLALVPAIWGLPALHDVQFPWRLLGVVEFAAVTALALQPPRPLWLALGALLLAAAVAGGVEYRGAPLAPTIDETMTDAVEYLPAAYRPPEPLRTGVPPDLSSLRGPAVAGPVAAADFRPNGEADLVVSAPGRIVVRRAAFPAWRVRGPAGEVPTEPGPLVAFRATEPGRYALVRARTPVERLGLVLALAGLFGVALTTLRLRPSLSALRPLPAS
jgi:hypothetical protein